MRNLGSLSHVFSFDQMSLCRLSSQGFCIKKLIKTEIVQKTHGILGRGQEPRTALRLRATTRPSDAHRDTPMQSCQKTRTMLAFAEAVLQLSAELWPPFLLLKLGLLLMRILNLLQIRKKKSE